MAVARDAYAWIREHFLLHPELLGRLLHLCTGLLPPPVATASRRGDEVLLRVQGGETPWYLLSLLGRPDPEKVVDWALGWLDLTEAEREPGWLVVLTDAQEVMAWLEGPDFRPRYGVGVLPLALDLTHQVEVLRRSRDPLLTVLGAWAARERPAQRLALLEQLVGELVARDDPLLGVSLLRGARTFGGPRLEAALRELRPRDPPRWWAPAVEE